MKISIAIMGHPKRKAAVDSLYEKLAAMPFERVYIILDNNNDEWTTGKRSLKSGLGVAEWHVVIQDDALLTPSFYENIEGAINAMSTKTLISLYTGTSRPLGKRVKAAVDKSTDGDWLMFHQLLWGVGIAMPSDHIQPVLDFVEDIELQYDNKIGEFYTQNGLPVYYCIPSLVDHDDAAGSLLGHGVNPEPRVAHRLATEPIRWSDKSRYI